MNGNRLRLDRATGTSWIVSALLHAGIAWLLLSILLPHDEPLKSLEIEGAAAEPGAELVFFDMTIAEPQLDEAPRRTETIGDMSAAPLAITTPALTLASVTGGIGNHLVASGTQAAATGGVGRADFFGTQAVGDRFVYVVDTSGSMNAGRGRRLRRAIGELLRSVDQLTEGQYFYVLLFASETRRLFDSKDPIPNMVPATKKNKVRLRRWIRTVRPTGATHPQEALQIGIEMRPSAMFLLSDGKFSGSRARWYFAGAEPEVRVLVTRNNPGKVPIHTVAFEEPRARENLREISTMTSGQFVYVPETFRERLRERRAAEWMVIANKLETEGRPDMAQRYYEKIVRHFSGSDLAQEAGRRHHEYLVTNSAAR